MEIHILLAGEEIGPFSETQIRQYLGEGLVAPSDLATYEGMEDWQPIDFILTHLPSSAPKTTSPGPPLRPPGPAASSTDPVLPITASQKTKRKLGKIVIQPILPLGTTVSSTKKPKTAKTALTMEPLRPTTSLPPLPGPLPREKKNGKTFIPPVQLSPEDYPEKPATAPTASPTSPVSPSPDWQPPPLPPTESSESVTEPPAPTPWIERIPRAVIYISFLAAFFVVLVLAFIYHQSLQNETPSAPPPVQPEAAPPPPSHAETPSPAAVPQTAADYSARGVARQAKGDLDGAIADYDQALNLDPRDLQTCYRRALARQAKGNWNGAIADYNAILSLNPRNADAFSNRGFVKQALGDADGALADYNQALLINSKIPVAYYNVGLIKVQKGDLDGAIAAYNQALDLDPKMAIAYYNRGNAKNTEGNLDGAIADYTQALALNPRIAPAYCSRGFARQAKGDADGAYADYTEAVTLNPRMADAYYNRSLIKIQRGDLDGAIVDCTQVIDLNPRNAQAYCNRGLARLGQGNLDGAMTDLREFCELSPRDSGADAARLYLWLIAAQENSKAKADQDLAASLQNDWNSPPEDFSSKIAAFLLGHINEDALIANAASPDQSREPAQYCKAWYFAGMKRLLSGDNTTAISYFQKCLATNQKDFCEYIFAKAKLQTLDQDHVTPPKAAPAP